MSLLLKTGFLVGFCGAFKTGGRGKGLAAERQALIRNLEPSVPLPQAWGGKGLWIEVIASEE